MHQLFRFRTVPTAEYALPGVKTLGARLAQTFASTEAQDGDNKELSLCVMIAGPPGVGKSAFINTVLGLYGSAQALLEKGSSFAETADQMRSVTYNVTRQNRTKQVTLSLIELSCGNEDQDSMLTRASGLIAKGIDPRCACHCYL